jgi:hypothetical protein
MNEKIFYKCDDCKHQWENGQSCEHALTCMKYEYYEPKHIDTDGINYIVCPWCGAKNDIELGDIIYDDQITTEYCRVCDKEFKNQYSVDITYYTRSWKVEDKND